MKKIRLFLTGLLLMMGAAAFAQDITVTGTVTDASTGEGIYGVTVLLQGDNTKYASTDDMGAYSITVPADGVLEVRFMGYATQEIPVNGRSVIDVEMEIESEMLDDVVVVGYGSARKITSVVGSASTVNKKVIANRPSANAGDALQGQVSGLQVFTSSGEPTEGVSMRLRGVNSINAGTTPLIVLDGAPVSSDVFSSLNSNDIENIVVMKDASSTAIYGSRAANGVIYITTKKGQMGEKPVVSLRGQYGFSTLMEHHVDLMNTEQWMDWQYMADPTFKPSAAQQLAMDLGISTDWRDYFFKNIAPVWSADMSVSGASEKADYYISLGVFDQEGTLPSSFVTRYTFRSNVNIRATDWLKVGANVGVSYEDYIYNVYASSGNNLYNPVYASNVFMPWVSPYEIVEDEDGNAYVDYSSEREYLDEMGLYNPNYLIGIQPASQGLARVNGSTYLELTPIKGLTIRSQQNIEAFDYRMSSKTKPEGPYDPETGETYSSVSESFQRYYQMTFTNTAEYRFKVADKNEFIILLGQEAIISDSNQFGGTAREITDWRTNLLTQGNQELNTFSNSLSASTFNSYFARLSYSFDDKYYVDASWRIDGSSRFGTDSKYANFYSIGGMWDIKREEWMQGVSWINDLRLKASYGTTGNASIGNYEWIGTVGQNGYYNGAMAWGIGNPENPNLTWETVESVNVGVSARLWNFMDVSVEFYNKVTHDLLMAIPYSMTTGHSAGAGNAGDMLNRGVDVDLSFDIIQTRDIYFNVKTNFNYNKNEILELFGGRDEYVLGNALSYHVGYPYGEFYNVRSAGVDPRDGMQMWYDKNGNITKTFSDDNAVMTGKQMFAPWSGGVQLNFQYKGLYVGADFSWMAGKWTINNDRYFLINPLFLSDGNGAAELLDMWMEPGDKTDVPGVNSARNFDDTLIEDASFLRLKNLQVSYDFPKKWMDRTGFIAGFRIYAIARNLFTITKYSGYDPEVDSNLQMGVYPNSRQFTIGAEFTF